MPNSKNPKTKLKKSSKRAKAKSKNECQQQRAFPPNGSTGNVVRELNF